MSLNLYQFAPTNMNNIVLPDRTYKYATNKSISTFHPAKTFCMVNDGKGNITKVEFKAGMIVVTKSGSTFTVKATLTTTDDKEFTASYTGPITIEDKTAVKIEPLPTSKTTSRTQLSSAHWLNTITTMPARQTTAS